MLDKFMMFMLLGPAKRDEKGATATEYALLVGLIALVLVLAVTFFGNALSTFFSGLGSTVASW